MFRTSFFNLRVNDPDRAVFKAVADRLERSESEAIRIVMRKVAEELGVSPGSHPIQTSDERKAA